MADAQNNANIRQHGSGSTATQDQTGKGNKGVITQGNDGTIPGITSANGTYSKNDFASQSQSGSSNEAQILQHRRTGTVNGVETNNSATQEQRGNGNKALVDQEYSNHIAVQKQGGVGAATGDLNRASIVQKGDGGAVGNYASQDQQGNSNVATIEQGAAAGQVGGNSADILRNQATQLQQGNANRGKIEQNSADNFASQSQIGNSNFAQTLQGRANSMDAGWSTVTQQGNNNSSMVNQGRQ
jgi:hypothetical protein